MEWIIENEKLTKEFSFVNFNEAVAFIQKIAKAANKMDHHPDILLHSYIKVKIILFTHSEKKITNLDHKLAKKLDSIY